MAVSKNQGRLQENARKRFYDGDSDCLPKYNYSNGAGMKTKSRRQWSFAIKSKRRVGDYTYA
jgi:hypothetical protein